MVIPKAIVTLRSLVALVSPLSRRARLTTLSSLSSHHSFGPIYSPTQTSPPISIKKKLKLNSLPRIKPITHNVKLQENQWHYIIISAISETYIGKRCQTRGRGTVINSNRNEFSALMVSVRQDILLLPLSTPPLSLYSPGFSYFPDESLEQGSRQIYDDVLALSSYIDLYPKSNTK
ncbi:hypothetical protein YC2023_119122 [Brassica napus]